MDTTEQILSRLDRIIVLLEGLRPATRVPEPPRMAVGEPEKARPNLSEDLFTKIAPEVVDFLVETMNLPKISFNADLLSEELGSNPTSTVRVLRRLAEDKILSIDHEGFVSLPDPGVAKVWLSSHPLPPIEIKPLETYMHLQAVRLISILMSDSALLTGKVISTLAQEMEQSRNSTERLVRTLTVSLPFVTKPQNPGSPVRIRPTMLGLARKWLSEAERVPVEQKAADIDVGRVLDHTYDAAAPQILTMLLAKDTTTAELMNGTKTSYRQVRAILKRLHEEGVPIKVGVAAPGHAPQVRLEDPAAASQWLAKGVPQVAAPMTRFDDVSPH
jgi:hypothetical protein